MLINSITFVEGFHKLLSRWWFQTLLLMISFDVTLILSIIFLLFLDFHFLSTTIFTFAVFLALLVLVTFASGRRSVNQNNIGWRHKDYDLITLDNFTLNITIITIIDNNFRPQVSVVSTHNKKIKKKKLIFMNVIHILFHINVSNPLIGRQDILSTLQPLCSPN